MEVQSLEHVVCRVILLRSHICPIQQSCANERKYSVAGSVDSFEALRNNCTALFTTRGWT